MGAGWERTFVAHIICLMGSAISERCRLGVTMMAIFLALQSFSLRRDTNWARTSMSHIKSDFRGSGSVATTFSASPTTSTSHICKWEWNTDGLEKGSTETPFAVRRQTQRYGLTHRVILYAGEERQRELAKKYLHGEQTFLINKYGCVQELVCAMATA
jgi:hypothetical protein